MQPVSLFLIPTIASFIWPAIMLVSNKPMFKAQWLMLITQVIIGCSIGLYDAYYGELIHNSYVADVMYTIVAVFCAPTFYMFVCSLSGKYGITRQNRLIYIPTLIYLISFVVIVFTLGGERYDQYMVNVIDNGNYTLRPSKAYTAMIIVGYWGFRGFILLQTVLVLIFSAVKIKRYHKELRSRNIIPSSARYVHTCSYLMALVITWLAIFPRRMSSGEVSPLLVVLAILCAVLQLLVGYYAYRIRFTAEQLEIMRHEEELRHKPTPYSIEENPQM